MRTLGVVEHKILAQSNYQFAHRGIAVEVDILVLDVAPQTFYKNVVKGPAPSVHADFDLLALEYPCEAGAGELCALVAVEDVGLAIVAQRLLQAVDAKVGHPAVTRIPRA